MPDHTGVPDPSPEIADLLPALDPLVDQARAAHPDEPELLEVFTAALRNTISTTIRRKPDGTTFVATGDIAAMWLRDSSAQVETYLRVAATHAGLRDALVGVVKRQAAYYAIDPYANAYNEHPTDGHDEHGHDTPPPLPDVWEQKYELDSLCYPIRLAHLLWQRAETTDHFDDATLAMFRSMLALMEVEQEHEERSPYRFERSGENLPPTETLTRDGKGSPTGYTGMVWSGFRPSDDACTYHYLVPANMFAAVSMDQLVEIADEVYDAEELAEQAKRIGREIRAGLQEHAIVEHPVRGRMWAYEVDGLGNQLLTDDANTPSLLSAPYLGFCAPDDPTYLATRSFILSGDNPTYYVGTAAAGIGSPHTPPRFVWHMALTMQAMTSTDPAEQEALVQTLLATTGGTGLMHEGFDVDDPAHFTRPWFGWANSLFAELVLRLTD